MINREEKVAKARELFLQGYNCAQAVAAAFAPEMGMGESEVLRLSSCFGGGLGGVRLTCGAVAGMGLVLSQVHGYDKAEDTEAKKALYARMQQLAAAFTDRYETLICRELLEKNGVEVTGTPSERTPEYYRKRPCVRYVEACAGILADHLE